MGGRRSGEFQDSQESQGSSLPHRKKSRFSSFMNDLTRLYYHADGGGGGSTLIFGSSNVSR